MIPKLHTHLIQMMENCNFMVISGFRLPKRMDEIWVGVHTYESISKYLPVILRKIFANILFAVWQRSLSDERFVATSFQS